MPVDGAVIGLLFSVFWVWMLIDCLFNRKLSGGSKSSWALFIVFTQAIGAMFYFFIRCNNRNPFEAVASYYKTLMQWWQSTSPARPNAPFYSPKPSVVAQPLQHDYQEGYSSYQYQPPQQQAIIPLNQVPNAQPDAQQTQDEQYEQPMISYPEMP
ncbi:MAG: PLD nuclease N-terminal domain-containing protein [Ktedonobacteraceae bacterium]